MTLFLFDGFMALYVLHATRNLHLTPSELAVVNTLAALGALAGATSVNRLNRRSGKHVVITLGLGVTAVGFLAYSQVPPGSSAVVLAGAAMFLVNGGLTAYTINYLAMRQIITPDTMLGRMTSTMRFLSVSAAPIGSSLSGYCADRFGIATVVLAQGVALVAASFLARSLIARALPAGPSSGGDVVKAAA